MGETGESTRDWTVPPEGFDSLRDAAPHLRRPFSPNSIKWRVVQANMIVPYIDARAAEERLNRLLPHLWEDDYRPYGDRVESKLVICKLTVDGISRKDVGSYSSQDPEKGGYSDSFKRAALKFGINQPTYAMKRIWHPKGNKSEAYCDPGVRDGVPCLQFQGKTQKDKDRWGTTDAVDEYLRNLYEKWAKQDHVIAQFGPILDHGDEPDAIGEEPPVAVPEEEPVDLELAAQRQEIEAAYAELNAAARKKLQPAVFRTRLDGAKDKAELNELAAKVKELAGD